MSLQSSGLSEEKRAKLEAEIVQKQSLVEEHLFDLLDIDHLYKETEELFQAAEAKSQEEEDHRTAINDLEEKKQAKLRN